MNRSKIQLSPSHIVTLMCGLAVGLCGCQSGGIQGIPSLSTLNSPTRVPPPATGSFAAPQGYGATGVSGPTSSTNIKPVGSTLAQLRTLETGKNIGDVFGSEGSIPPTDIAQGTLAARPVVAPPITPIRAIVGNPEQAVQAAAVSFSQPTAPPVVTASALSSQGSANLSLGELSDPRSGLQDSHAQISDGVTWKTAQR